MQEEKRQWLCRMFLVFLMSFCLTVFAGSAFLAHADGYPLEEEVQYSSWMEQEALTIGSSDYQREEEGSFILEPEMEPENSMTWEPIMDQSGNLDTDTNGNKEETGEGPTIGMSEETSSLTIGESEDLTIGVSSTAVPPSRDDEILGELTSIRECLQIIVYYVVPAAVAVLLLYKFCIWFYKTFIDSAFL